MASSSINPFKQGQAVVPKFKGTDYKDWAYAMQAALEGVDLWLISGAPAAIHIARPGFADPNAPTDAENAARHQWDVADGRAIGYLKSYVERTVMEKVLSNIGTAGRLTSKAIWDELKDVYDVTSAAKVFALFRQSREWRLDASKPPVPQLDALDYLYQCYGLTLCKPPLPLYVTDCPDSLIRLPLSVVPCLIPICVLPYYLLPCCDVCTYNDVRAYIKALVYGCQALSLTYNQSAFSDIIPCA
jgi:hypothetical protein